MNVRVVQRSSGASRCGYCHDSLGDVRPSACPACAATYHDDCAAELAGRCGTRGCTREVVRALAPRVVVARPAAARDGFRWGWVLAALLVALTFIGLPLTVAVVGARRREAERAAVDAAAAAEVSGKLSQIAAVAQAYTPTAEELDRARRLYRELQARGLVSRRWVAEQVRRGSASYGIYGIYSTYPSGSALRGQDDRVDAITR